MKKLIALALTFLSALAMAGPGDLEINQYDQFGIGRIPRLMPIPAASASGVLVYDGVTTWPRIATLGSGLSYSSGVLSATSTARTFSYTTRALNTCFQPSASRDTLVSYSVDIATSLSLTAGQQGTVYLRTYTNNSCSAGAQELTRFVNGQTGTLTVGLSLTQNVTGTLTGVIPAGAWAQLVTENNTGTPTFTARPGQEVGL